MGKFSYEIADEQTIFFDLPDGMKMHTTLRGELGGALAVILHGRPANGEIEPYRAISRYLGGQGISSLRLSLQSFEPNTRNIQDCSLQTYIADTQDVMSQLRDNPDINQIAIVAHSYGQFILGGLSKENEPDVAVSLDPSHGLYWRDHQFNESEIIVGDWVIGTKGAGYCYPLSFYETEKQLGDTTRLAIKNYPIKFIEAGAGILKEYVQTYYDAANSPKSLVVIDGADHNFTASDGVTLAACQEVYQWINEHTKNHDQDK